MSSENYALRRSGIYRNLPTFDPALRELNAIVVGATGISGFNTIRSLLDSPERWSTVHALSRSPLSDEMLSLLSPEQKSRIKHTCIDLTNSADDIASSLQGGDVQAEYVFFYGYIHPEGISAMDPQAEERMVEANVPIFEKFLKALPMANIKPTRILLQTGGKNYGGHIGRARTPCVESDPQPRHLSKNFYYAQEDLLQEYCREHPECGWNVIRPFIIIGAVPKAGMNCFLPFAIMASVCAKKREPVFFGGDIEEWQHEALHSSARLTGFLSEWAVLEDKCRNQAFNSHDGSPLTWDRFFEELTRWYEVDQGVSGPELDEACFQITQYKGGKEAPLGYGPPPLLKLSRTIQDWSEEPSNQEAWKELMTESNGQLRVDVFQDGMNAVMGDFVCTMAGRPASAKLCRFGFNGFVDTMESVFEMYTDMAKMGILPYPKASAAQPMI